MAEVVPPAAAVEPVRAQRSVGPKLAMYRSRFPEEKHILLLFSYGSVPAALLGRDAGPEFFLQVFL